MDADLEFFPSKGFGESVLPMFGSVSAIPEEATGTGELRRDVDTAEVRRIGRHHDVGATPGTLANYLRPHRRHGSAREEHEVDAVVPLRGVVLGVQLGPCEPGMLDGIGVDHPIGGPPPRLREGQRRGELHLQVAELRLDGLLRPILVGGLIHVAGNEDRESREERHPGLRQEVAHLGSPGGPGFMDGILFSVDEPAPETLDAQELLGLIGGRREMGVEHEDPQATFRLRHHAPSLRRDAHDGNAAHDGGAPLLVHVVPAQHPSEALWAVPEALSPDGALLDALDVGAGGPDHVGGPIQRQPSRLETSGPVVRRPDGW
jgi:hypothetical protein